MVRPAVGSGTDPAGPVMTGIEEEVNKFLILLENARINLFQIFYKVTVGFCA
jgi:hypothetical protein